MRSIFISCVLLLASEWASAAAFQVLELGASQQGSSNAGTAVSDDASVSFLNPAAMQNIKGHELSLAATYLDAHAGFKPLVMTRGGVDRLGNTQHNSIADKKLVIPQFYYVLPLSNDMRFGFSMTAPYGLESEYPNESAARYFATFSSVHTYNANPALSYQVDPKWSVGAGVNVQYVEADLNSMFAAGANDVAVKNSGNDWGVGWNAGVQFTPNARAKLGLSYRSKISYNLSGDTKVYAPTAAALAVAAGLGIADGDANVNITLPESAIFSGSYDLTPQLKLLGDVQWTRWSRVKEIDLFFGPQQRLKSILTKYYDTYRLAAGLQYQYNSKLRLRAGLAKDQSPVSSRYRTARIPDNDRTWTSFGLGYRYNENWNIDAAYSFVHIRGSTVNESDATLNHTLFAKYKSFAQLVGLQVGYRFS